MEARLKYLEGQAGKAEDLQIRQGLKNEAATLAKELAAFDVPDAPQLFCDDETPENLARLLSRQGGRMLQTSAEGTAFEIAKGRYSETANFDVYLKGHAGDTLRVGRISRQGETVEQPALSVAVAVQPDVIRGLATEASMKGRGFLARYLFGVPKSLVGRRKTKPKPMPTTVANAYREKMQLVWALEGKKGGNGKPTTTFIRFSPSADAKMEEFEAWLEPQLGDGEPLSSLAGWANKLAGAIARIAGILHVAAGAGGADYGLEISDETVEAAVRIGRDYLLPHAKAAFALMGADPRTHDAQQILKWLKNATGDSVKTVNSVKGGGLFAVSRRDIHAGVFGGSRRAEELEPALGLLVEFGYLRQADEQQRPGPGR
jgi:hypothetical protein